MSLRGRIMKDSYISNSAVHKLIELAGAERVGDDAVEELRRAIEEIAIYIGKEAVELASHAKRRTVKINDISFAIKRLKLHSFIGSNLSKE